jgi:TATA-box binding protein (TBP) (component of TFIID and TFIIIB)
MFFLDTSTSDDKVTMLFQNVVTDYPLMRRYILEGKDSAIRISLRSETFDETFSGMVTNFKKPQQICLLFLCSLNVGRTVQLVEKIHHKTRDSGF